MAGSIMIPEGHRLVGTCGKCGGPVITPIVYAGGMSGGRPVQWCLSCGACATRRINPEYGPILTMDEYRRVED